MLLKICKCLGHLDSLGLFGYGSKPWHTLVQKSEKDRCSSTNVAIALSAGKNMRKPWSLFVVFLILTFVCILNSLKPMDPFPVQHTQRS